MKVVHNHHCYYNHQRVVVRMMIRVEVETIGIIVVEVAVAVMAKYLPPIKYMAYLNTYLMASPASRN